MYPELVDDMVQATAYAMGVGIVAMRRIVGAGERNGEWFNQLVLDEATRKEFQNFVRDLDNALEVDGLEAIDETFAQLDIPEQLKTTLKDIVISKLR
jgi:hypothetical protein